jgi:hypothetical protein
MVPDYIFIKQRLAYHLGISTTDIRCNKKKYNFLLVYNIRIGDIEANHYLVFNPVDFQDEKWSFDEVEVEDAITNWIDSFKSISHITLDLSQHIPIDECQAHLSELQTRYKLKLLSKMK